MNGTDPIELRTDSAEATREVGEAIAPLLREGDIVSLAGELGAGKTAFVQGAARGLGVTTPVASPTFVLVRDYLGALPVHHVDVYRLGRLQEVIDLGFEEMLEDGVTFVEWGSSVEALFADAYLEVRLSGIDDDPDLRAIKLSAVGEAWAERWPDLERAAAPWSVQK